MGESYYDVLGVPRDASAAEITVAYRERVLETHPDRNDDSDAAEQFDAVTTAEAVLSDETERARYDRLGHDAYVSMARGVSRGGSASTGDTGSTTEPTGETNTQRTTADADAGADAGDRTTGSRSAGSRAAGGRHRRRESGRSGPSHHARQRGRREWSHWSGDRTRTDTGPADRESVGEDSTGGPGTANPGPNSTPSGSTAGSDSDPDSAAGEESFRYAVHDWTDEVDPRRPSRPLGQSMLVLVSCVALVYPVLVYSSLTPQFPLAINGVVAACTLALVGYLLTMPRAAVVAFGSWSALVPVGLSFLTPYDPLSFVGVAVLAAFWVPFGYALTVWRILDP